MLARELTAPLTLVLYIFRNEGEEEKVYQIRQERDVTQLVQYLQSIEYDGATDLSYVTRVKPSHVFDYVLLFSDGISSMGAANINVAELKIAAPVYAISSALVHNAAVLRALAQSTVSQSSRHPLVDTCHSGWRVLQSAKQYR